MSDYDYCIGMFLEGKSVRVSNLNGGLRNVNRLINIFNKQTNYKVKLIKMQRNYYLTAKYKAETKLLGVGKIYDGFITIAKESLLKEKLKEQDLKFGRNEGCGIGEA